MYVSPLSPHFVLYRFSPYFRFGQAGGFVSLRERFDAIMGFQKPDLTSSVHCEEKVSKEITEKEIEENKINKVDSTDNVDVIASRSEVSSLFLTIPC